MEVFRKLECTVECNIHNGLCSSQSLCSVITFSVHVDLVLPLTVKKEEYIYHIRLSDIYKQASQELKSIIDFVENCEPKCKNSKESEEGQFMPHEIRYYFK